MRAPLRASLVVPGRTPAVHPLRRCVLVARPAHVCSGCNVPATSCPRNVRVPEIASAYSVSGNYARACGRRPLISSPPSPLPSRLGKKSLLGIPPTSSLVSYYPRLRLVLAAPAARRRELYPGFRRDTEVDHHGPGRVSPPLQGPCHVGHSSRPLSRYES